MDILLKLKRDENIQAAHANELLIDLEEYTRIVVACEIGNAPIEACAAQAVAARTYAYRKMKNNGFLTDLSTSDQAFRICKSTGYPNADDGTKQTANQVLYYNTKIAETCYSNSNGGKTTSAAARWGSDIPYLIEKIDTYDNGSGNGHGVGLSQVGAKNRAKAGLNWKQILDFYYPGTQLKEVDNMTSNEQKIKQWCLDRVGGGYLWGAATEKLTESQLRDLCNQYPDHVSYDAGKKWLGKPTYDCAQFVRYAMKQIGISMVSGATSQWKKTNWAKTGTIDTLPKNQIALLYRDNNGTKEHTGVYLGDGTFADARSTSQGILHNPIESYKRWTHWGQPVGLYEEGGPIIVLYKAIVTADSGSTVNMRQRATTASPIVRSIPVNAEVEVLEENGEWNKISYDNETGYMMAKFLKKQEGGSYVKIPCGNREEAELLVQLLKQAIVG